VMQAAQLGNHEGGRAKMMAREPGSRTILACFILASLGSPGCGNSGTSPANFRMLPTTTTKSGIEMVVIPAGSFDMGNRKGREEERPPHNVRVDSFLLDKHELTKAEYQRLGLIDAFPDPSHFKGPDLPVEQV